ncbi:MAG: phytoene/squalene synthase family protein [Caulobacteraceae bacterium]|nr:phytoene/squalene synthase family protein [Caulobacter sp.]
MSVDTAAASAEVIAAGSQSFAAAAKLLPARQRDDARRLYAWCRWCDDVMDGQALGHGATALTVDERRARLAELERATRSALAGEPQSALPFQALQEVATRVELEPRWPLEHLAGFAADVEPQPFADLDALLGYCWGVAGVVGVMMARVMGVAADDLDTLRRAQDLGLAFQLTNIARDVGEDARNGRVYLPASLLDGAPPTPAAVLDRANAAPVVAATRALVEAAEPYYASAAAGLPRLRLSAAWGIAAARAVYREIGREVARRGERALAERVVVGAARKRALAASALSPALASRLAWPATRAALWSAV